MKKRPDPLRAKVPRMKVPYAAMDAAMRKKPRVNPFKIAQHPPGVMGANKSMARDASLTSFNSWATQSWGAQVFSEGLEFLGYPYLAELSQRPEYRVIAETIATESTRKGIKIVTTDTDGDKTKAIKLITEEFKRLKVMDCMRIASEQDGFFGRAHLYLDTGDTDDPDELKTPIGDGFNDISKGKVSKEKPLARLANVEAVWTYPTNYDSQDPLKPTWYNPESWFVMGKQLHSSRLLTFVGREVPDLLKPAYSFGGLSMSQMAKPYIYKCLKIRNGVADLEKAFSVMGLKTNLADSLQAGGDDVFKRVDLFTLGRDNRGTMIIDKDTEEFFNVQASLSTLDALQSQAQEHMSSVSRIPIVKLLGIQPAGLNASSEGEIRVWYDWVEAYQQLFHLPKLTRILGFVQLSLFGAVDPSITVTFEPLWAMTDKEEAELQKTKAETGSILIDAGVIGPDEERARVAGDAGSDYQGLDVNKMPEPPDNGGGDDDEKDEQFNEDDGDKGEGGQSDEFQAEDAEIDVEEREQNLLRMSRSQLVETATEAALPRDKIFQYRSNNSLPKQTLIRNILEHEIRQSAGPFAHDEEFKEGDHPRAPDGKFGSAGHGKAPIAMKDMRQVGKQMGSNPGGVFANEGGEKFYVKRGKSAEHVTNEKVAAHLYALADSPTLQYRNVEGGEHIATEMSKLDKKRVQDLNPAELKEAQKEFGVHAWLSNWDAVGLSGDNIGTINGKPTSLDLGGALAYRAQGAPKGKAFGHSVGELDTLRAKSVNPIAAKVFGTMTPEQIKSSVEKVTKIPDAHIKQAVEMAGGKPELANTLIGRKRDMAKRFKLATDEFTESKHPRGNSHNAGQFAPSAGGGGAAIKGEGEKADTPTDHIIKKVLSKPAGISNKYRQALKEMIKHTEAKGGDTGPLKTKLAESYAAKFAQSGEEKYKKAAEKHGHKVEASPAPAKAAEPAAHKYSNPEPKAVTTNYASAELAKAKKATPIKTDGYSEYTEAAKEFNKKHSGENAPKTDEDAAKKIEAYKSLQKFSQELNVEKQAVIQKQAAETAAKQKAEQAAEAERNASKNAQVMKDLGINQQEALGFNALVKMLGGKQSDLVASFKDHEEKAKKLGYPISGFQAALIKNYSGSGYGAVNKALRSGSWSEAQHVYVKMVNKALQKMPTHNSGDNFDLTRNTSLTLEQQKKYANAGHIIQEDALMSTSTGNVFSGNTKFKVKACGKRGAQIKKLSGHPSENEVLFSSHTFFKVVKVEGAPGGSMTVHMEEMDD